MTLPGYHSWIVWLLLVHSAHTACMGDRVMLDFWRQVESVQQAVRLDGSGSVSLCRWPRVRGQTRTWKFGSSRIHVVPSSRPFTVSLLRQYNIVDLSAAIKAPLR